MGKPFAIVAIVLCLAGKVGLAQAPQAPRPGPEQKKLGYFIGRWSIEAEFKQSSMGPGGKMTGSSDEQWLPGGFFVVAHEAYAGDMETGKALSIKGYDAAEKVYTYQAYNSSGQSESAKGTVVGDDWTWTSSLKMNGKLVKTRFTIHIVSPTEYAMKYEIEGNQGGWTTTMEGKATKVQAMRSPAIK